MNIDDLIKLIGDENGYKEVIADIKMQEYAGARIKTYQYDIIGIKDNGDGTVSLELDYWRDKP